MVALWCCVVALRWYGVVWGHCGDVVLCGGTVVMRCCVVALWWCVVLCSGIVVMWCCVVALWGCFVLCGATFTYVINNHVYVLLYSCTDFHNLCTGIPESIFYSRRLEQNLGRNIQTVTLFEGGCSCAIVCGSVTWKYLLDTCVSEKRKWKVIILYMKTANKYSPLHQAHFHCL